MANVKRTFTLPDEVSSDLDETIPNRERSKFIATTLREALKKRKMKELLEMLKNIEPKKNPNGISSEEILRQIRSGRAHDIVSNS